MQPFCGLNIQLFCVYLLVYAGKLRSNKEINKQINIMNENVCSERSTRWRVRENIRQSPSVWHFFKQLGVWLFSALTTTSTVGSKISAAEFKISGFSLLLVVPEMCLAGITVKQQEMEPRGKDTKPQFYFEVKEELKMPHGYLEVIQDQYWCIAQISILRASLLCAQCIFLL